MRKKFAPALLLALCAAACTGGGGSLGVGGGVLAEAREWLPLPGGALSGPEVVCPRTFATDLRSVKMEVRPAQPYSIRARNVVFEGALYVPGEKAWAQDVLADARVRIGSGGLVHTCNALPVRDEEILGYLQSALERKYAYSLQWWLGEEKAPHWFRVEARN